MDREDFASELEACAGMLYRVAWSILHSGADAQDAMQEAALKAWEKRDRLREPRYFRTWLTRILINTCYDMRRRSRRIVLMDTLQLSPPEPVPDAGLSAALTALPEKLRLPLVLCYSEGMTYAEAARTLGLPAATVRGRIHRGKEMLRKELEAE